MSYKVLVIPEDFTKDEHILKPLAERILRDLGKPHATVEVCRDPNFGGIGEALKIKRLRKVIAQIVRPTCSSSSWTGMANRGARQR